MEEAQRQAALAVRRVLDGATLPAALATAAAAGGEDAGRRRALVQELAYGTLRHWGMLSGIVDALKSKPFSDPALPVLVAVAIYQLDHLRAPPFAVVDHAVDAAVRIARPAAKGLVNALLRRYLRERDALRTAVARDPVARWSHPRWWIERVAADHPHEWETILAAGNEHPPLALRVNARATSRDVFIAACASASITAVPAGAAGVIIGPPRPIAEIPGYAEGWFAVQDLGAQLAAPLLAPQSGQRVLDACAAPGGKTTHLVELADVDVVALDSDASRLARLRENLARLRHDGRRVRVVVGDAGAPGPWWDGRPFDRILIDAPCSASGVVRRHPDGKWLHRASDIASYRREQARILDALWPCLAEGGLMLYATCSVFRAENEDTVAAFCVRHADALREPINFPADVAAHGGQLLPSLPGAAHNQDGFFYALLKKGAPAAPAADSHLQTKEGG
jgi:16S rRNA (cytosine967-C5)-methyltransferase